MQIGEQSNSINTMNLLSRAGQTPMSDKTKAGETSSTEPPQQANGPTDFDAFMAAWGTSNAEFDLDGSGVVDGADLGLYLSQIAAEPEEEEDSSENLNSLLAPFAGEESESHPDSEENISQIAVQPEITNAIDAARQQQASARYSAGEALTRANAIMKSMEDGSLQINQSGKFTVASSSQDSAGVNAYSLLAQLRGKEGMLM